MRKFAQSGHPGEECTTANNFFYSNVLLFVRFDLTAVTIGLVFKLICFEVPETEKQTLTQGCQIFS
jgi:hypothetical protein